MNTTALPDIRFLILIRRHFTKNCIEIIIFKMNINSVLSKIKTLVHSLQKHKHYIIAIMILDSIYNFNITRFSCWLTVKRRVPLVELEWLILPEHLSSPTISSEFRVAKCVSFQSSILSTIVIVFCPLYCQTRDYIIGICCFSTK